jgi:hypothetical protein
MRRACATLWIVLAAAAPAAGAGRFADAVAVAVSGSPGAYQFRVTLESPDQSCSRYASWWEVVRADGSLAYRRILEHSHPDEQPFTRAGGPVPVGPDETVVVRAFLHPDGYGGALLRGSVRSGFAPWLDAPRDFGAALATAAPQPERCLY